METVEGKVLNVKAKMSRNNTEYQGVTLGRASDGAKFWFGNYGAESFVRGDLVRVEAESTADGNNITFLNKVKSAVKLGTDSRPDTRAAPPPGSRPAAAAADPTGWENEPAKAKPEPASAPAPDAAVDPFSHNVTENASPLGTLDDLADGEDPSCYGGVINFKKGTTKAEVEFLLRALAGVLKSADIREYDGAEGSPVYYIP